MEQHDALFVFLVKAEQHYFWLPQNKTTNNTQYLPSHPTGQKWASNSNFLFTVPKKNTLKSSLGFEMSIFIDMHHFLNIALSKYWRY